MKSGTSAFAVIMLVAWGAGAVCFAQTVPGTPGTPPPPPVPFVTSSPLISTSPEPQALPSTTPTPDFSSPAPTSAPSTSVSSAPTGTGGRHHHKAEPSPEPSASDTPEPARYSTLDGVWEIALQPLNGGRTIYSHLYITQKGDTLTGTWRRTAKTALPFTGTFDGRLLKLNVVAGSTTQTLSGYEENFSDMVGLYTDGDPKHAGTPFTAGHRPSTRERQVEDSRTPYTPAPRSSPTPFGMRQGP